MLFRSMWRDFEIKPLNGDEKTLLITYKRNYWAKNCLLTIVGSGEKHEIKLDDFSPESQRIVEIPFHSKSFHWQINYITHSGLSMTAIGAYPKSVEALDFLNSLKQRDTFSFLKDLFNTEVLTINGEKAPPTLEELKRGDGVIQIAFRKPNGVIYLAAFARVNPGKGYYIKADITTSFTGNITSVDEWTGKPISFNNKIEQSGFGLRIKNVKIPIIPGPIGQRSNRPISIPVFRITPYHD